MAEFRQTYQGRIGGALPGLGAMISVLDLVGPALAILNGIMTTASVILNAIAAVVEIVVGLLIALLAAGGNALGEILGLISKLAEKLTDLQDAASQAGSAKYQFNGKVGDYARAIEAFFAQGSPGSTLGPDDEIHAISLLTASNSAFAGLSALFGPQKAAGTVRIRLTEPSVVRFWGGTTFTPTAEPGRQYHPSNERTLPFAYDPLSRSRAIPLDELTLYAPPGSFARGFVRLTVSERTEVYFNPNWVLMTGIPDESQVFLLDFGTGLFMQIVDPDSPFVGWWRLAPDRFTARDVSDGTQVFDVMIPVRANLYGPAGNLGANQTFTLKDSRSSFAPERSRDGLTHATGTVRVVLSGKNLTSNNVFLSKNYRLTSGQVGDIVMRYALDQSKPPFVTGVDGPYLPWLDMIEVGGLDPRLGPARVVDLPVRSWSTSPKANRSLGAAFTAEGEILNGATFIRAWAETPVVGAVHVSVPGWGTDDLILEPMTNPAAFTGGQETPEAYWYVDIPIQAADTTTEYNQNQGTAFTVPGLEVVSGNLLDIKAVTPIGGALDADPAHRAGYPKPLPKPPDAEDTDPVLASAVQLRKLRDLALALYGHGGRYTAGVEQVLLTKAGLKVGRTIAELEKLTRLEARQVIADLEAKLRNAKAKRKGNDVVPIPSPFLGLQLLDRSQLSSGMPFLGLLSGLLDGMRTQLDRAVLAIDKFVNQGRNQSLGLEAIRWRFACDKIAIDNQNEEMEWQLAKLNAFVTLKDIAFSLGDFWIFKYEGSSREYGPAVRQVLAGGLPGDAGGPDRQVWGQMFVYEDETSWLVAGKLFGMND